MYKITYKGCVLLFMFFQFAIVVTKSQKSNLIGVNFIGEVASESSQFKDFRFASGFLYERQMSNHSGFETGLYIRSYKQEWLQYTGEITDYQAVSELYLSLPILYKYYSKVLNIAGGATFDYFFGWKQIDDDGGAVITYYDLSPKIYYGLMVKISKPFELNEQFILEPEIRYNPILSYSKSYYGVGLAVKYKL